MKKIFSSTFLFLTFTAALATTAAAKTVAVEWDMPTESIANIQSYILNYSPNSDMTDATPQTCDPWHQTEVVGDQTSFTMTCNNVPVIPGQLAYFTLEATDTEGTASMSAIFIKDTKLSNVLNFQVLTPSANIPPTAIISASVTTGNAPLTVNFDGSESTDTDGSVMSYSWDFGDGSPIDATINPSHTYSTVGSFQVSLTVVDDKQTSSTESILSIQTMDNIELSMLDIRIATGTDDAEEAANGNVTIASSDLELVEEVSTQLVGLRFQNVTIPPQSTIINAYIEFEVDETSTTATSLSIAVEDSANALGFTTSSNNIANRQTIGSPIMWNNISEWPSVDEKHQTPDVSQLIKAVIDRPDWNMGNSLVFIISGSGRRTAESFEGENAGAALLHIEYQ